MQPNHRLCWDDLLIPLVAASFVMDAQSEKQAIWRQRSRWMGMTDVPRKNWGSWKHSVAASKQHPPSPLISIVKKLLGHSFTLTVNFRIATLIFSKLIKWNIRMTYVPGLYCMCLYLLLYLHKIYLVTVKLHNVYMLTSPSPLPFCTITLWERWMSFLLAFFISFL